MNVGLRGLIGDLVAQSGGSQKQFAKAIGITPSTLSRLGGTTQPRVELCLRIAVVGNAHPSRVLRAAGYADVADLIETLYGAAARHVQTGPRFTVAEQHRIDGMRRVPPPVRRALEKLIDATIDAQEQTTAHRPIPIRKSA